MTLLDSNVAICESERGFAHRDRARRMIVEAVSTGGAAVNAEGTERHRAARIFRDAGVAQRLAAVLARSRTGF